jgi:hypothetical protein
MEDRTKLTGAGNAPRLRHALVGLILLIGLSFWACGTRSSGEDAEIEMVIQTAATSRDPTDCTRFATQKFIEQSTGTEGPKAIRRCEEEAHELHSHVETVSVSDIDVMGSQASADVEITGGNLDGQTLKVVLIRDGRRWKQNEIVGFAKLDRVKLVEAFKMKFAKPTHAMPHEVALCVERELEEASQAAIENYLFSGSLEAIDELYRQCSTSELS